MVADTREFIVDLTHSATGMTLVIEGLRARDAATASVIAPHATARPMAWRVTRVRHVQTVMTLARQRLEFL